MNPTFTRLRRALALPSVVGISVILLVAGLAVATANGKLTAASAAISMSASGSTTMWFLAPPRA